MLGVVEANRDPPPPGREPVVTVTGIDDGLLEAINTIAVGAVLLGLAHRSPASQARSSGLHSFGCSRPVRRHLAGNLTGGNCTTEMYVHDCDNCGN